MGDSQAAIAADSSLLDLDTSGRTYLGVFDVLVQERKMIVQKQSLKLAIHTPSARANKSYSQPCPHLYYRSTHTPGC